MAKQGNTNIVVTEVVDPHNFSARIGTKTEIHQFHEFDRALQKYGETCTDETNIDELRVGQHVLAQSKLGNWNRSEISYINRENGDVDVYYIDFGQTQIVYGTDIVPYIPQPFQESDVPPYAHTCRLADVKPLTNCWINRATTFFKNIVHNKTLSVEIIGEDRGVFSVRVKGNDGVFIHNLLIKEELAMTDKSVDLANTDEMEVKKSLKTDIPHFDLNQLSKPRAIESDDEPKDSLEYQLAFKDVDTKDCWEQSDLTIGSKKYKSNLSQMDNVHKTMTKLGQGRGRGMSSPNRPKKGFENEDRRPSGLTKESKYSHLHEEDEKLKGRNRDTQQRYVPPKGRRDEKPQPTAERYTDTFMDRSNSQMRDKYKKESFKEKVGPKKSMLRENYTKPTRFHSQKDAGSFKADSEKGDSKVADNKEDKRWKEKLKNDYEWYKIKTESRLRQILARFVKEKTLSEDSLQELKEIVYPAQSLFDGLPGEKEMYLCIWTIIDSYMDDFITTQQVLELLTVLHIGADFSSNLLKVLNRVEEKEIQTSCHDRNRCQAFCNVLSDIYMFSSDWRNNASLAASQAVISALHKWILNDKGKRSCSDVAQLYTNCSVSVLRAVGRDLVERQLREFNQFKIEINIKIFDSSIPRSNREDLLNLLIFLEGLDKRSVCLNKSCQAFPCLNNASTSTDDLVKYIEGNGQGQDDTDSDEEECNMTKEVEAMLRLLKLQHLADKFEDNGIRDSLLKIDQVDLKSLLKECDIPNGYIMEICMYLKKKASLSGSASSSCAKRRSSSLSFSETMDQHYQTKTDVKHHSDFESYNAPVKNYTRHSSFDNADFETNVKSGEPFAMVSKSPYKYSLEENNNEHKRLRTPKADSIKSIVFDWIYKDNTEPQHESSHAQSTAPSGDEHQFSGSIKSVSTLTSINQRRKIRSPTLEKMIAEKDLREQADFDFPPLPEAAKPKRKTKEKSPVFEDSVPKTRFGEMQICAICGSRIHTTVQCTENQKYILH